MKPKMSRMEGNKEIRRVLARHSVDLSYCSYSCTGREIRLTGTLVKIDGSDFHPHQIEVLIQDFARHLAGYSIHGELDNWNFSQDHISKLSETREIYYEDMIESGPDQGEDAA